MDPGACGKFRRERCRTGQNEAKRNKSISDMKDQNQAVGKSPVASPSCQAQSVYETSGEERDARGSRVRGEGPEKQCCRHCSYRKGVKPPERGWQPPLIEARQPVAREAWDDASANERITRRIVAAMPTHFLNSCLPANCASR